MDAMTAVNPPAETTFPATPHGRTRTGSPAVVKSRPGRSRDRADLSRIARLLDRLRQTDATRSRKIEAIKREVDAGTYETDARLDAALGALLAELA